MDGVDFIGANAAHRDGRDSCVGNKLAPKLPVGWTNEYFMFGRLSLAV
jgi:hypothetical protein